MSSIWASTWLIFFVLWRLECSKSDKLTAQNAALRRQLQEHTLDPVPPWTIG